MIVNEGPDEIAVQSCNDMLQCFAKISHIGPHGIGNITKFSMPLSSPTLRLTINGKKSDGQDGLFYKWTGSNLSAMGTIKQWADAVHALPARRRLLKKH
jgi:hypothetical protein